MERNREVYRAAYQTRSMYLGFDTGKEKSFERRAIFERAVKTCLWHVFSVRGPNGRQPTQTESKVQTIEKTVEVERTELLIAVFGAFDGETAP